MSKVSNKQRLLALREIFEKESDENNRLSLNDIGERLKKKFGPDFTVENKAIRDDIETLNESGFNIIDEQLHGGAPKLYSHEDRIFEVYQLRLLTDAVISARFITKKESQKLIANIKKLTSKPTAEQIQGNVIFSYKAEEEKVKYYIDKIHRAISQQKTISFQYGKFNANLKFELSRDGELYNVQPYGLVWNNDFYYLVGKYLRKNEFRHYRIDRMRNVIVQDKNIFTKDSNFNIDEHIQKSFYMYPGKEEEISIQFNNQLINAVIDKVGLNSDIQRVNANSFKLTMKAAINEGLIRWILTWGSDAKVLSPEKLVDQVKKEANKMQELYHQ